MLALPSSPPTTMDPLQRNSNRRLPPGAASRQYAIPAGPFPPRLSQFRPNNLSYVEHEMLRQRKTPHGLLVEQDFDVVDKSVQIPASKHVLLSSSPNHPTAQSAYFDRAQHSQAGGVRQRDYQKRSPYGFEQNPMPYLEKPSWNFPGGLDSVLNQTLPVHPSQRYYLQQGSKVPTVLPSVVRPSWGPTASASQENWGPYWPDGTFSPYRPASIRDMRYHGSRQAPTEQYSFTQGQLRSVPQLRRSGTLPYVLPDPSRYQTQSYQQQYLGEAAEHLWPRESALFGFPTAQQNATSYNQHLQQSYGLQARVSPEQDFITPTYAGLKPGPESEQIAFRDRSFTWADRIYRDLLATIHRNSREGHHFGLSGFGKGPTKLTIYPKPPKRTGSHFSNNIATSSATGSAMQNDLQPLKVDPVRDAEPPRPRTAIYSPHRRASDFGHPAQQHSYDAATHDSAIARAGVQDLRRISDSGVNRASGLKQAQQVRQSAFNALSTMEILCEQARAPWIDGMLLAGCLAYGLGTYDKALGWYNAILAHDNTHVEAMSNLAATLLALNRRDEAMHHWFEAVRLRPSYFEAVEHLVGLLCSSRRAREAVDLIEFVESSLKADKEAMATAGELSSDAESDAKSNTSSIATMFVCGTSTLRLRKRQSWRDFTAS